MVSIPLFDLGLWRCGPISTMMRLSFYNCNKNNSIVQQRTIAAHDVLSMLNSVCRSQQNPWFCRSNRCFCTPVEQEAETLAMETLLSLPSYPLRFEAEKKNDTQSALSVVQRTMPRLVNYSKLQ